MGSSKFLLITLLATMWISQARAEDSEAAEGKYEPPPAPTVLQFADEELPREAVMPKLDSPKAVLSRKLSYENRWQADLGAGWLLDEAFYNNQYMVVQGTYSWNEPSGVGLKYLMFGSGLSDYGKQFEGSNSVPPPDFDRSVGPKSGWMAYYERRMMYGKLSVSKWNIIPAFLTWNVEAGMLKYGTRQLPIVGGSLSNRYFLKPHFAVGFGIHAYVRQMVDPLSADLRNTPVPAEGDFKTNTKFSMAMDFGLSYLF